MSESPLSRRVAERPKPPVPTAEPEPAPADVVETAPTPVYRVLTGALGKRFVRGDLVTPADLGAGVDVTRLVRIGAVELA